jgi:hypothetical protein
VTALPARYEPIDHEADAALMLEGEIRHQLAICPLPSNSADAAEMAGRNAAFYRRRAEELDAHAAHRQRCEQLAEVWLIIASRQSVAADSYIEEIERRRVLKRAGGVL